MTSDFRIAVLLSGAGSTMLNLQSHIASGDVPGKIVVVVSSRKNVLGVERAKSLGIPTRILHRTPFIANGVFDADAYASALCDIMKEFAPQLVVMAGFMTRLSGVFLSRYPTINVHPALLPMFGGEGFFGHHVHEAVLRSGVKITGATVHFADPEYDKGPIIAQEAVAVLETDSPDTLAARVQEAERRIYPEAVRLIALGLVEIVGCRTRIKEMGSP